MKKNSVTMSSLLLVVLLVCMPLIPGCNCEGLMNDDFSGCSLELTYPAGKSPQVFTSGWVFGAKCIINPGTPEEKDVSDQVKWSGSGDFSPEQGAVCHPTFNSEGTNSITLSYTDDSKNVSRNFRVNAVSPDNYAYVGATAFCPADSHGCPACPHAVSGPITTGSPNVFVNGLPAARQGDSGTHAACCGPNTFTISEGDPAVLINGKPAARFGDQTQHCGGVGSIVRVVPSAEGNASAWDEKYWQGLVTDSRAADTPLEDRRSINDKLRSEKVRLKLVLQFQYEKQPPGWQFLKPGDDGYDEAQEQFKQIKETKRRISIVEGLSGGQG